MLRRSSFLDGFVRSITALFVFLYSTRRLVGIRLTFRVLAVVLGCVALTGVMFGKTDTSVSLSSSLNPSTYGNSVTFTATVTPSAATGTVTFKNGSVVMGTGTISSGQATYITFA